MNLSQALYLCNNATKCGQRWGQRYVPTDLPVVETLLMGEMIGGRTVRFDDGVELRFVLEDVKHILTEDPDVIAGKYKRNAYITHAFMGDEHGAVINPAVRRNAHTLLLAELHKKGAIALQKGVFLLDILKIPKRYFVCGQPKKLNYKYSGVILPKQTKIDGSYISLWGPSCSGGAQAVIEWTRQYCAAPFYLEQPEPSDDMFGKFVVSVL